MGDTGRVREWRLLHVEMARRLKEMLTDGAAARKGYATFLTAANNEVRSRGDLSLTDRLHDMVVLCTWAG